MNKTTNQYINQLNLDPKREAAVRKLVEGAGGVSNSTPLVENLVGNELIPIKQDGENKAVSVEQIKNNVLALPSKYEFVDLGLPSGTKWATCNVGANSPEEAGLVFKWAHIEGDYVLDADIISTNKYLVNNNYIKYNDTDQCYTLKLEDDAAYQSDDKCRMPTQEECTELINNTIIQSHTTANGVSGYLYTSKINNNSIFFPKAPIYRYGEITSYADGVWTSTTYNGYNKRAGMFSDKYVVDMLRYLERPIRPVQPANTPTTINLKELQDKVDNIEIQSKEAKEVYHLDINNYSTAEDFNNLKDAIDNNKLIKVKHNGGLFDVIYHESETLDKNQITLFFGASWVNIGSNRAYYPTITGSVYVFFDDGICVKVFQNKPSDITFNINGDGTKFLADDGSYKTIDIASILSRLDALEGK